MEDLVTTDQPGAAVERGREPARHAAPAPGSDGQPGVVDQPGAPFAAADPPDEDVYSSAESALIARRLEALGYIE
jgi:hypothetical protein